MKITFPHLGNLGMVLATVFNHLGAHTILPPPTSKNTIELGCTMTPEDACLPLKITVGNLLEAEKMGANIVVMGGGIGPCRFGLYGEVQKVIMESLHNKMEIIIFEPSIKDLWLKGRYLLGQINYPNLLYGIRLAWQKLLAMEEIEKLLLTIRAGEKEIGSSEKQYGLFRKRMEKACTSWEIKKILKETSDILKSTPYDPARKLFTIGLVGEIYTVMEKSANFNIERTLNRLGAQVEKNIYLSAWVRENLLPGFKNKKVLKAAAPYLGEFVGGHGRETVGESLLLLEDGKDGIIQLAPLTCMPEIIAQSVLLEEKINYNLPILSLYLDEHSQEVGLHTRIEAFLDMLYHRKERELDR